MALLKLRLFAGLTIEQVAAALGISCRNASAKPSTLCNGALIDTAPIKRSLILARRNLWTSFLFSNFLGGRLSSNAVRGAGYRPHRVPQIL